MSHFKDMPIVILGDSHPEMALIADSIEGSFNLSLGSERHTENYKKLRVLSDTYALRLVIVGLSYHSFLCPRKKLNSNEIQRRLDFYYKYCFTLYPFIRKEKRQEHMEMFDRSTMREVMLCYELGIPSRNSVAQIKQFLRGYPITALPSTLVAPIPIDWENRIMRHFYEKDTSLREIDYSCIAGVGEIDSFCKEKGYTLILFNAPLPQSYYVHIPLVYKQLTDSVVNALVDNQTTFYLDYTQYPLPDSCFRDGDHTNLYGANIITPLVRDSLRALGLLPTH
ncbi:MAG: hypothetical protein LBU03_00765 [Tannerellaceae bacterium]|nr:hypothetical protein [Tannerellaceae bacterium]